MVLLYAIPITTFSQASDLACRVQGKLQKSDHNFDPPFVICPGALPHRAYSKINIIRIIIQEIERKGKRGSNMTGEWKVTSMRIGGEMKYIATRVKDTSQIMHCGNTENAGEYSTDRASVQALVDSLNAERG